MQQPVRSNLAVGRLPFPFCNCRGRAASACSMPKRLCHTHHATSSARRRSADEEPPEEHARWCASESSRRWAADGGQILPAQDGLRACSYMPSRFWAAARPSLLLARIPPALPVSHVCPAERRLVRDWPCHGVWRSLAALMQRAEAACALRDWARSTDERTAATLWAALWATTLCSMDPPSRCLRWTAPRTGMALQSSWVVPAHSLRRIRVPIPLRLPGFGTFSAPPVLTPVPLVVLAGLPRMGSNKCQELPRLARQVSRCSRVSSCTISVPSLLVASILVASTPMNGS